jgi:hypothetical protein
MVLRDPMFLENAGEVYNAREYRALLSALHRGKAGVLGTGDLAVTQQAVPALGVTVATGAGLVAATGPGISGLYFLDNNGAVDVAIAAPDATNPRRDIVGLRVRDSESAGADNDGTIAVITGTPNAVPVDPVLPANFLPLARVAVAALAASIVNANITDLRVPASRAGLRREGTEAQRLAATGLTAGEQWYETGTGRLFLWTGAAWQAIPTGARIARGVSSASTDAGGNITVAHGLGAVPASVVTSLGAGNSLPVIQVAKIARGGVDANNFAVYVHRTDTNLPLATTQVIFDWIAST